MDCLTSLVKYIIYLLNVIFVAGGVLLIVVGSIILNDMGSFGSFDQAIHTRIIPILIILLGCIIFIISFFGCCGAIRENACCTTIYASFMFILFALQIALTVWIFVKRDDFLSTMREVVQTAWNENDSNNGYPMDALQIAFKCCGDQSYQDYTLNATKVPASCCGYTNRTETCPESIYKSRSGCQEIFVNFWSSNMDIILWSGIGIAVFEFVIFVISCCLAGNMRQRL